MVCPGLSFEKGRRPNGVVQSRGLPWYSASSRMPVPQYQIFRQQQVTTIPTGIGVYVLCDLDEVPIYVGKSTDGIRNRVRRHLTSARSDTIANRQLDVWEVRLSGLILARRERTLRRSRPSSSINTILRAR